MSEQMKKIVAARDHIQARTQIRPQIAVILGSEQASFACGSIIPIDGGRI